MRHEADMPGLVEDRNLKMVGPVGQIRFNICEGHYGIISPSEDEGRYSKC